MILNYASKELQADTEVVFAAVKNNGHALAYASIENLANHKVVQAALLNKDDALKFAYEILSMRYYKIDKKYATSKQTAAEAFSEFENKKNLLSSYGSLY